MKTETMMLIQSILNAVQGTLVIIAMILWVYFLIDISYNYFKFSIEPTNFDLFIVVILSTTIINSKNQTQ